ncbi:MAG: aminotransferase class III-fold pyridoxal phosphate-dependent enzyme [Trueperaceae bacterium]|nr:aminotransferase class III-fold pyridoxal phosphate-dependent enzyme [Trueperaceae bacterium]
MDKQQLKDSSSKYQLHPMGNPASFQNKAPHIIQKGEGVYIIDIDGKRMVDATAGLWNVNIGHNRQEVKDAIVAQLDELVYYSNFHGMTNPRSIELSERVIGMTKPEGMARVMFSSNGSDAVETALKLARQYWKAAGEPQRVKFFSLKEGYHGTHFGGASVNGNARFRKAYEPLLPYCYQIDSPWTFRNPYTEDPEALGEIIANLLDREIQAQNPETVAAFIAEPIQGAGGVIVPPANFWPLIRDVCDKHGVLLIADEVITGFGRSGTMFGSRTWGVKPDMMTMAKGITSGYIPLGATVINKRINDAIEASSDPVMHGYTYAGHPVACAASLANLDIVEKENLPENARLQGEYFLAALSKLQAKHALIGDVRGKGLMAAVELVAKRQTKERLQPDLAQKMSAICQDEGAMIRVLPTGVIVMSPPLIIQKPELDIIVNALDTALTKLSD